MSNVPKLRFKEFSEDWKLTTLDHLSEIVMGQSPIGESYNSEGEGIGLINGPVEFTNKYPIVVQYTTKPTKYCYNGDILFCVRGSSIGRMNKSDSTYCIGRGVASIKAKENKSVTNYVHLLLQSKLDEILSFANGSTFPNISSAELKKINIKVPKLEEQEKIASFFSLIDDKISLQGEKVEALKDYKKGMMQKIFSKELRFKDDCGIDYPEWEDKKLGELITINSGGSPTNILDEGGSIPYFKVEQLNNSFKYQINTPYKISDYKKLIKKGSIIFPKRGAAILLNKIRILAQDSYMDTNLMTLTVKSSSINNEYLYYFIIKENLSKLADTTSIPQINNKHIEPYDIKIPVREEQDKIVNLLGSIDIKLEKEQEKLDLLNEYKKGLLQQMFI